MHVALHAERCVVCKLWCKANMLMMLDAGTGTLPEEYAELSHLRFLGVDNNLLNGTHPLLVEHSRNHPDTVMTEHSRSGVLVQAHFRQPSQT